jgi:homocysteine S-methyltransferase
VRFLDALAERPVIGDGAMGTLLYSMGVPLDQSFDSLNLVHPEKVRTIHELYIDAGAQLIETNTFGANGDFLARFGLRDKAAAINEAGARLAREAVAGRDVFVAGAIGPLTRQSSRSETISDDDRRLIFREQAEALANGGVDLLMIETFPDFAQLKLAYEAARAATDLPIVAQMTFVERTGTLSGDEPLSTLTEIWRLGADVVGVNCGRGPKLILDILREFAPNTGIPLSAFFNAGSPDLIDGRYSYLQHPQYLADMAEQLVDVGVNLIGGCCGTTPEIIAIIAERLASVSLKERPKVPLPPPARVEHGEDPVFPPSFLDKPDSEPSVIVELDPPRGLNYEKALEGARAMREAGVDLVSVAENPLASPRMGNVAMALLMKEHAGIEPLVHFTCRDRNLIGLQSDIMGAYALGLRYLLCITGDPVPFGGEFGAKGVYDVASFGLIKLVSGLNRGFNAAGASIQRPTRLRIGVAFSSNVKHLHVQVQRLERKIGLGAHFALTQPCWDPERIAAIFDAVRDLPIQLYMGVMPFASERNCEFLHNEVPGMLVPDEVRARMKGLRGAEGRKEGRRICEEILDVIAAHSGRAYIITPFNHYETSARLAEHFMERVRVRAKV